MRLSQIESRRTTQGWPGRDAFHRVLAPANPYGSAKLPVTMACHGRAAANPYRSMAMTPPNVPKGQRDNSPAFQRRVTIAPTTSPEGTAETTFQLDPHHRSRASSGPSGLEPIFETYPALKRRAIVERPSGTNPTFPLTPVIQEDRS